ncbi:Rieske 2Fe-2S family protein [Burkholderia sp. GAS332]|nr:Rieske 2Fe-2S family protein [Burkholderia sp. GAS332]
MEAYSENDALEDQLIRGRSLPQRFYQDAEIFEKDMRFISSSMWLMVDHESRVRNAGDFFLVEIGTESVIVARHASGKINAFYNVCRHRGSRICLKESGNSRSLVCPYHAWTYDLEGTLRSAKSMPVGFDPAMNSLIPCHVRVEEGLIFLNLSKEDAPDFDDFFSRARPYLVPHGLGKAKIAASEKYPTMANWKLLVENFLECYHCKAAHPTYCAVHDAEKIVAMGAGAGSGDAVAGQFQATFEKWEDSARRLGHFTGSFADDTDSVNFQSGARIPVKEGAVTESISGAQVGPLMGDFQQFDGGQTGFVFNPFSTVLACNDHAVMLSFIPRTALTADVIAIWLVREDSVQGTDYDPEDVKKVWHVTLQEDKTITENNQRGVSSRAYSPGTYSLQEQRISDFVEWYRGKVWAKSNA